MARKTTVSVVKPPPPVKIEPDFARARARTLWKGYSKVVTALEKKVARKTTLTPTRSGRIMRAGNSKERYENKLSGNEVEPVRPRTPPKVHPSAYMKARKGAEKYVSPSKGDPYP